MGSEDVAQVDCNGRMEGIRQYSEFRGSMYAKSFCCDELLSNCGMVMVSPTCIG